MAGVVAEGLGDTVDHGVDPAGAGHAADVDLQAGLAARGSCGCRASSAAGCCRPGVRPSPRARCRRRAQSHRGWPDILAGAGTGEWPCAVSPCTRSGPVRRLPSAFGRRRFQGGAARIDEARAQAAAGQQARQGLRIVEVTAQGRRRLAGGNAAPITRSTPVSRL
jgi:hypothetical protein